jgi:hypothetical protein
MKTTKCISWGILSDFSYYPKEIDAVLIFYLNIESTDKETLHLAYYHNEMDWFLYRLPNGEYDEQ